MIYHCIRCTLDPHKLAEFETDAHRWTEARTTLDARENAENAERSGCILVEDRPYFYRIDGSEVEKGP